MKKPNIIRYIGNIVTVVVIFLIYRKLLSYDLKYTLFLQPHVAICIGICLVAYVINVLASPLPWMQMLKITSNYKVPYQTAVSVSVRSNLFKYIPGNIFQYIGKNELAIRCGISHTKVAASTALDVIVMFSTSILLGILFVRKSLFSIINRYINLNSVIIVTIFIFFLLIFFFLYIVHKKNISYMKILRIIAKRKNLNCIVLCIIYYIIQNIWVGLIYILELWIISDQQIEAIPFLLIIGANIISWAIGFITPGAPGGLGIREAVMIFIVHGIFDESIITLSSVLYRIITIVGDLLSFLLVGGFYKIKQLLYNKRTNK